VDECCFYIADSVEQLNAAWNNVYRKIFEFKQRESVKEVQYWCDRLDFIRLLDSYKFRPTFLYKSKDKMHRPQLFNRAYCYNVIIMLNTAFKNVKVRRWYYG